MTDDDKKPEDGVRSAAGSAPAEPVSSDPPQPEEPAIVVSEPLLSEPVPDLKSDPVSPEPPVSHVPAASAPRRGGFMAPLLGGALAAAAGFALSHYNILDLRADSSAVENRLATLESRLDTVGAEAGTALAAGQKADEALALAQQASEAAGQGSADDIAALQGRIAETEAALSALSEAAPDGSVPAAAFASLKAEVEALRAEAPTNGAAADPEEIRSLIAGELDARAAEITAKAEEEAAALREAARREAGVNALIEAVNGGQPYAAALAVLGAEAPDAALVTYAETGIPSLATLTASFPEAARQALEASLRGEGGQSLSDRAWAMLRIGTGARSLSPQQGSDPDAVLSRAEAAVKAGDLATALTELEALPETGKAAMTSWSQNARARLDAAAALAALSAQQPQ